MILDMNEDVAIFTESTSGYTVSGTDSWKRRILAFFLIAQNLVPLPLSSNAYPTSWYHSEKWKEKREERGTATLRCISRHHSASQEMRTAGVSLGLYILPFEKQF